jgi:histone deacetylase HOS3
MATIFLQNACFAHRYIRSRDTSAIVERPERLRAVELGLAAVIARFESVLLQTFTSPEPNDLVSALEQMTLATGPSKSIPVVTSSASVNILQHPAVKFVHGDIDGDVYLQNLQLWAKDSLDKITKGDSEIPEELSQGDLYRE